MLVIERFAGKILRDLLIKLIDLRPISGVRIFRLSGVRPGLAYQCVKNYRCHSPSTSSSLTHLYLWIKLAGQRVSLAFLSHFRNHIKANIAFSME